MASKSLYVGNLPYSVRESNLIDHFAAYGATSVRLVEGRGFGFVDIDADKLSEAIEKMNNTDLDGRTITVSEARPREERNGGGGYRSGGGGSRGRGW